MQDHHLAPLVRVLEKRHHRRQRRVEHRIGIAGDHAGGLDGLKVNRPRVGVAGKLCGQRLVALKQGGRILFDCTGSACLGRRAAQRDKCAKHR